MNVDMVARFHTLVIEGARISFTSEEVSQVRTGTIGDIRRDDTAQLPLLVNIDYPPPNIWGDRRLIRYGDVLDVLPDKSNIEEVEAWLERGPLVNPYRTSNVSVTITSTSSVPPPGLFDIQFKTDEAIARVNELALRIAKDTPFPF